MDLRLTGANQSEFQDVLVLANTHKNLLANKMGHLRWLGRSLANRKVTHF